MGNHPKESWASLGVIEADSATLNGGGRVRKPPASPRRKPTPRRRVRWKAVQLPRAPIPRAPNYGAQHQSRIVPWIVSMCPGRSHTRQEGLASFDGTVD